MIRMVICMVIIDIRLILIVAEIAGMAIRMFIKMVIGQDVNEDGQISLQDGPNGQ